jgi:HlyD family secretion protein
MTRPPLDQVPALLQNIAASQPGQPVALLPSPWMDAPHPPTRGVALLGLISMAIFLGGFAAWSFFAPLAEAAIAEGVISVEGEHRIIANQEGGTVQELLVHDGEHVRAGQVLMRMNDAQASATAETAKAQRWTLLAQLARLDSEAAGDRKIQFQSELLAAGGGRGLDAARAADAMSVQRALFDARTVGLNSQIAVLQDRVDQQLAVISSAEQQQRATEQQLELIRREIEVKQTLLSKGLSRLSEVLQLQRTEAALNGTLGDLAGQVQRARASIAESRSSMKQTRDQRLQEVSDDRRDARSKLNETEDNLRAAQDVAVRRDVVAPEDGTILNMHIFNVGAVVDVVYPGLDAQVRLPAFKQRLVPSVGGHVIFVASDVTADEKTKTDYYKTQILLDRDQLEHLPNVHLTPGMPVEAMVQLGERSFFRYITQPIRDSFHRAFHEQ